MDELLEKNIELRSQLSEGEKTFMDCVDNIHKIDSKTFYKLTHNMMKKEMDEAEKNINKYVRSKSYPDIDTIYNFIFKELNVDKDKNVIAFVSYTPKNHCLCKQMYENIDKKDIIFRNVNIIYNDIGKTGLLKVLYIFTTTIYYITAKNIMEESINCMVIDKIVRDQCSKIIDI